MLPEILSMIELQRRWDAVLHGRAETASARSVIAAEEKGAASAARDHASREKALAAAKAELKAKEVDLLETESLLEKLQAKSFEAVSKRELKAVEAETEAASQKKGGLEESILTLMDSIASQETALASSAAELAALTASAKEKVSVMKERITRFDGIISENETAFKTGLESLSPKTKSRFGKMVTSADGKGIVPIEGEHCGGCRFVIPFDIRREASAGADFVSCPHCGKYIYALGEHSS